MRIYQIRHTIRLGQVRAYNTIPPLSKDVNYNIISEETCVTYRGEVIAVYKKVDFEIEELRKACLGLKFNSYYRTSGLKTQTETINASPRNGLRTNKCELAKIRKTLPTIHDVFLDYAKRISRMYRLYFKKAFADQIKHSYIGKRRVNEVYRIQGTPFTNGVINKNAALGYHRDSANTPNGISCMLILKKGVSGGELILPELELGFACQDGFMLLFDGQKYLHGVTSIIQPQSGKGYRYTVVYYNNKGMSLCLPPPEEELHYRDYLEKKAESINKSQ